MDNEMKERLIEVITNSGVCEGEFGDPTQRHIAEDLAKVIIADGWIRLPLVQEIPTTNFNEVLNTFDESSTFWEYVYVQDGKIAIDIFATEAEAMAALREGKG